MDDIRLKKLPFEYNGKIYELSCNFNVLADIQEACGDIPDLLEKKGILKKLRLFICAMVNDYADSMEWPERVTPLEIGRVIDIRDHKLMQGVMSLVQEALYMKEDGSEGEPSKN